MNRAIEIDAGGDYKGFHIVPGAARVDQGPFEPWFSIVAPLAGGGQVTVYRSEDGAPSFKRDHDAWRAARAEAVALIDRMVPLVRGWPLPLITTRFGSGVLLYGFLEVGEGYRGCVYFGAPDAPPLVSECLETDTSDAAALARAKRHAESLLGDAAG